jgi:hypothetical protein
VTQVKACGRLVEQEDTRSGDSLSAGELHENAREMRTLLFAAGKRGDDASTARREIDFFKRLRDPRSRLWVPNVAKAHAHNLVDSERGIWSAYTQGNSMRYERLAINVNLGET